MRADAKRGGARKVGPTSLPMMMWAAVLVLFTLVVRPEMALAACKTNCNPGQFCQTNNICRACTAQHGFKAHYQDLTGKTVACKPQTTECKAGTYFDYDLTTVRKKLIECIECDHGTYQDSMSHTSTKCKEGKKCTLVSKIHF
jgi:hypothetical protein